MDSENIPQLTQTPQPIPQEIKDSPKSNKLKIGIIIGGAILVVIVIVLVLLSTQKHIMKTITISPNNGGNRNLPTKSQLKEPSPAAVKLTPPASWYSLHTQYYSVTIPVGWKPTVEPMEGGVSVMLQPSNTPEVPLLAIESYNIPESIADKVALYEGMGLIKRTQTISNRQAVMVAGTWPTRTIEGKTIHTPTQERIVYIPHGDSEFTIRFYYSSSKPEPIYDDILTKVISSFKSVQ